MSEAQKIRERHEKARQRAEERERHEKASRRSPPSETNIKDYNDEYNKILKSNGVCPFPTPREFAADLLALKSTFAIKDAFPEEFKKLRKHGLLKYHPDKIADKSLTKLATIATTHWNNSKGGTRKVLKGGNEILKNRLQRRMCEKDICCEEDINRDVIIEMIIDNYKKICRNYQYENEYLNFINNDLLVFIGYKVNLKTDPSGEKLWNDLNKEMGDKQIDLIKVKRVLKDLPLSFLLAFLGLSTYKVKLNISF